MNLLHAIHRAEQAATALFSENGAAKITIRQAVLLAAAKAHPGASQTKLCAVTGIDRSTLADMVNRLVKRGWLKRVRSKDDARAYLVTLTPAGATVLAGATKSAAKAERALVVQFPGVKHLANGGGA